MTVLSGFVSGAFINYPERVEPRLSHLFTTTPRSENYHHIISTNIINIQDPTQATMEGKTYAQYHAGGGTTFIVPASPNALIREVRGDLFDAPEGSGLIRKLDRPLLLHPIR
jgi:hypothetical protein